ncbi:hypothetical protein B0A48_10384 [Cryoendolithus antarcticus]|uniref:Ubiquitin-like domain-containing protein n=1 Tax=Cryoendolithus antarcticus TaxID=1507870 RepID=A0A1V8SXB3_9PEZI|nr:hypothetical protein B0A48_10384 [Cryoendolithus antarcticus]
MSEVTFAKSFLSQLDKKPIKLPSDHVSDPRQYPNQSPFTLPRQTHPFPRRAVGVGAKAGEKEATVSVTLAPVRGGEGPVTLEGVGLDTSVHDLKTKYAEKTALPQEKIKLLYNKKPAGDLKTLKELGVTGSTVELGVMVLGGASAAVTPAAVEKGNPINDTTPAVPAVPAAAAEDKMDVDDPPSAIPGPGSETAKAESEGKAKGPSGPGALNTGEFWTDLQEFLTQRLRDGEEAERLIKVFKIAWINSKE